MKPRGIVAQPVPDQFPAIDFYYKLPMCRPSGHLPGSAEVIGSQVHPIGVSDYYEQLSVSESLIITGLDVSSSDESSDGKALGVWEPKRPLGKPQDLQGLGSNGRGTPWHLENTRNL